MKELRKFLASVSTFDRSNTSEQLFLAMKSLSKRKKNYESTSFNLNQLKKIALLTAKLFIEQH